MNNGRVEKQIQPYFRHGRLNCRNFFAAQLDLASQARLDGSRKNLGPFPGFSGREALESLEPQRRVGVDDADASKRRKVGVVVAHRVIGV